MVLSNFSSCKNFNQQALEINPVETFWFNLISDIFPNKVYRSVYICVFEIDVLLMINKRLYAFEIMGTHYTDDTIKDKKGKKKLKEEILKSMGVNVIDIVCSRLEPRIIMRFKDLEKGQ